MVRQGKYTKKQPPSTRARSGVKRKWRQFRDLSWKKKTLYFGGPIALFLLVTPLATYAYFARDIADQERLMNRNNTGVVLMDKNKKPFYSIGRAEKRELVKLGGIADVTEKALLSSEDKNFYKHGGFSITSIAGAVAGNVISRNATAYGGSTLTQQLAKNTLLSNNQTFLRKYQELAVSIAIEREYTKDEILEMYLNSVYFGENAFGIEDAAKTYFDKKPSELDLAESAMLIGVLPAPSAYSPISGDAKLAKQRQMTVLTRMVDNNIISSAEKEAALEDKLAYSDTANQNIGEAPHFAELVLNELYEKYGEEKVTRSGYRVVTTLDLELQKTMNAQVAAHLPYIQSRGGSNAGGVAIDPSSGQVLAMVGSIDYANKDFGTVNMAVTPRQPGSSFKPIYYSHALADGVITPATILHDKPTDFGGGYRPLNADRQFRGDISLRKAISQSLNIPSVEVMQGYGVEKSVQKANDMGLQLDTEKEYGLALALGTAETRLLDMTNAYAAYANAGDQFNPVLVREIESKYDKRIFKASETSHKAISPEGAYLISDILSDDNARAPIFGGSLSVPGRTVAVKTGTTDDSRDAWTIGYSKNLAVGVWVGNNNNEIMLSGGSDMAGPIWRGTMSEALATVADEPFFVPSDIVTRAVCFGSGGLAERAGTNTYNEKFLSTALPQKSCTAKQKPEPKKEEPKEPEKVEEKPPESESEPEPPIEPEPEPEQPTEPTDSDPNNPNEPTNPDGDNGNGSSNPPMTPGIIPQRNNGFGN